MVFIVKDIIFYSVWFFLITIVGALGIYIFAFNGMGWVAVLIAIPVIACLAYLLSKILALPGKTASLDERGLPPKAQKLLMPHYNACLAARESLLVKEKQFSQYSEDDSLRETYNLIADKIQSNISKADNYISGYDYISMPRPVYLEKLEHSSREMVVKLNELSDLALQIEDTATDVDSKSADYMLEALRDVLKEDDV